MKKVLTCTCGKKSTEVENTVVVHQASIDTGFGYIFTLDHDLIWLCPDCYAKAQELARALYELLKTPIPYIATLMNK